MTQETKETKSAGGVVLNKNGEVAIVSHAGREFWGFPKGHIDEGEDALTAAKREILEETGLTELALVKELGTYSRYKAGEDGKDDLTEKKIMTIFLFTTDEIDLKSQDIHNPEAKWVSKDKVVDLVTHPKDKEFFLSIKDKI